ncbi:hypothetical protein G6F16_002969 [Rhizopus arrhizus]|nr:hypothetical protein G6F21_004081 [Rhizopus arrhizus]KAG0819420.1 hypothetical protein G6F20_000773 [Rhizopus arrhizus]KAG0836566.1 hypothetical protein G6F18_005282 [Rhizopus arrhizus]KAG0838987.1 hypothetical protein G6F19_002818 [Rhizopus arrhizus]KAG0858476.1 hypothetical protein G6F17_002760 [Rhizopus arrhizus]
MLPQFGFIVAQAGADSQPSSNNQYPYYARPPFVYTPQQQNGYYEDQFYRPLQPLPPPILQHSTWHGGSNYRPFIQPPPPPPPHTQPAPPPVSTPTFSQPLPQLQHPQPPPPPVQSSPQPQPKQKPSTYEIKDDERIHDFEPHWRESNELSEHKILRRIREFNDLILWMDNEFWEQCDDVYREKLQSLQDEIKTIQQGTHSAFKETMADIELKREQTIEYAEHFKDYELSLAKHQFDIEMSIAEDEYKSEKHNLHDVVLQAIEERRKLIKEDKEDVDIDDMFNDVHTRLANSKRNLRKRTHPFDRHLSASPSRQERRRQNRIQTLYNIHAAPSSLEQEGLEEDFLNMKGVSTSIRKQGGHVHSSVINQSRR